MGSMDGMVAAVTGASRGIGAAIAKAYAEEGADVIVVARTEQEGGRLPGTIHGTVDQIKEAGGSAVAVKCDVTKDEEVQALAQASRTNSGVWTCWSTTPASGSRAFAGPGVPPLGPDHESQHAWPLPRLQTPGAHNGGAREGKHRQRDLQRSSEHQAKRCELLRLQGGVGRIHHRTGQGLEENDIAVNALSPGPIKTEGAVFTSPPDFDWKGWHPPEVLGRRPSGWPTRRPRLSPARSFTRTISARRGDLLTTGRRLRQD